MKKLKYLVILLAVVLVIPFAVFAEGEEGEGEPVVTSEEGADAVDEADPRAKVYFFYGNGCPHCAEAEEWFASIQEAYGDRFVIEDYETWYDEENSQLMLDVATARNEYDPENFGVPYILIGDKSWMGFAEGTMADEIIAQIDDVYNQPVAERYDALSYVGHSSSEEEEEKSTGSDIIGLIVILVIVALVGFGLFKSRKSMN